MNIKCKLCDEPIPPSHVQQGGMHMGCANSPQKLWEVSLPDDTGNSYIETDISGVATAVANSENGLLVKRKIMTAGEYFNLPEFKGF